MRSYKKIFVAFLLNLLFSAIELVGGIISGSVAILSDSVHDFGDAMRIGASFLLEKKSERSANDNYTYGYARYSILGGLITTLILIIGSVIVCIGAVKRIINPISINYNLMIILAVVGVAINLSATLLTKDGHSLNQKAVNLHMLEDVLGWIVVLIGAVVIKFTDFYLIDPIMSILISVYILVNAIKNLWEILRIVLLKTPRNVCVKQVEDIVLAVEGVQEIHHVHLWNLNEERICATFHLVINEYKPELKKVIKEKLKAINANHVVIETELSGEVCCEKECKIQTHSACHHHHHHHHH